MKPEEFLEQAILLTGSDLKGKDHIDMESLASILEDDTRQIDCSQFNELLLLVHKDRVELSFFSYFFGSPCRIGDINAGVTRFRKVAMLLFGNFVFGYRTLSRIKHEREFHQKLTDVIREPDQEQKRFQRRRPKLLDTDPIERDLTPFVGYLSAGQVIAERERCELLCKAVEQPGLSDWTELERRVKVLAKEQEHAVLMEIIANYRNRVASSDLLAFHTFLGESLVALDAERGKVQETRKRATRNQDIYLTWDHMDVYFATSMRKAWEYEDLHDFIHGLMEEPELADLGVHYFDPTQAYTTDRINKGLIEALMLKRARCTVYSVQDTDTLGKDSELASTLAQGKPVIAYVPRIDVDKRTSQLKAEEPGTILERLRFVLYADEQLPKRLEPSDYAVVDEVQDNLEDFVSRRIWLSLPDTAASNHLKGELGSKLEQFCKVIASSEKRVYDKRAETLTNTHPLAVQVNLATGVANGVLVVRCIPDCAKLLRRILLFDMQFTLENGPHMWYLREAISGCVYRVVTHDQKLSNCFWNFYLR